MQDLDYIVIRGGIVGLATAWTILGRRPRARVAVVEKEDAWAAIRLDGTAGSFTQGSTTSQGA
jgi:L-2-hydroxyglutarate oxidase